MLKLELRARFSKYEEKYYMLKLELRALIKIPGKMKFSTLCVRTKVTSVFLFLRKTILAVIGSCTTYDRDRIYYIVCSMLGLCYGYHTVITFPRTAVLFSDVFTYNTLLYTYPYHLCYW